MEIRQLEYFLKVAEVGSITAAARSLHIAQPSLSQALHKLERDVGAALFDRIGRGMKITSAGEALVGPASRMLREREDARAAVASVAGLAGGRLTISTLPSLAVDPVASLVGLFRARYPLVQIKIIESKLNDSIVEHVEQGVCDLGFARAPMRASTLDVITAGDQRLVLLAPVDFPNPPRPLSLKDMSALPFVCGPVGGSSRTVLEQALWSVGVDIEIVVEAESTEALVPLVVAGSGIAFIPEGMAAAAPASETKVLPMSEEIRRTTAVLHRPEMSSPVARAFIESIRSKAQR